MDITDVSAVDLVELSRQMHQLQKNREELLASQTAEREAAIKSLDWVANCDCTLEITGFWAAGIPAYKIHISGTVPPSPEFNSTICVHGDDPLYQRNMMYCGYSSHGLERGPHFYTSKKETLIEFIRKVKFKSLAYNTSDFDVLDAARMRAVELKSAQ